MLLVEKSILNARSFSEIDRQVSVSKVESFTLRFAKYGQIVGG